MACTVLPNTFGNVHTALQIEGVGAPGHREARDCVVFPQWISGGTGAIVVPTNLSGNGLVVVGSRLANGTLGGMYLPALANPTADPGAPGFLLFDPNVGRLRLWDGVTWRTIAQA